MEHWRKIVKDAEIMVEFNLIKVKTDVQQLSVLQPDPETDFVDAETEIHESTETKDVCLQDYSVTLHKHLSIYRHLKSILLPANSSLTEAHLTLCKALIIHLDTNVLAPLHNIDEILADICSMQHSL